MTDEPIPRIEAALSAVMGDVQAVGKTGRNTNQGYDFRGVDAVTNAVGPALRKHGVIVLPRVLSKQYSEFSAGGGGLMHQAILEVEFTFVGPLGDKLVCSAMGESASRDDKSSAKAHSVAFRTALLQALCIPTNEPDPDETTFERDSPPPAMSSSQQSALAAHFEAIADDDEAKTALRKWWRTQRLPHKDSLNGEQADQVLNHMSGGSTP